MDKCQKCKYPIDYKIMERYCKICHKTSDLLELEFAPDDTDAEMEWPTYVCRSCWEIIATIAKRVTNRILQSN